MSARNLEFLSNLAKHSTAQDHKSRRKSGSVVCLLLSKGDQRSVECSVTCQEPGSAGNERVCIICTLLREILSVRPLSLIYNSFVYGKSGPVFTAQDTIKCVLLILHTPSICHLVILRKGFYNATFCILQNYFCYF